jgi:hypothetical protein
MITYEAVKRLAESLEGEPIQTSRRKADVTVEVYGDGLIFTPASTKQPRPQSRKGIEQVLNRFNETQSLAPVDYQDITVNASYILTLIERLANR